MRGPRLRAPGVIKGGVHDRSPDPRLERAISTKSLAPPDDRAECLLHDVEGGLSVIGDGRGDAAKLRETLPVHGLDLT